VSNELGITPISAEIQPFTFRSSVMSEISKQDISNFLSVGFTHHRIIVPSADELRKLM
jgi:hypothetical protein